MQGGRGQLRNITFVLGDGAQALGAGVYPGGQTHTPQSWSPCVAFQVTYILHCTDIKDASEQDVSTQFAWLRPCQVQPTAHLGGFTRLGEHLLIGHCLVFSWGYPCPPAVCA